MLTCTNQCKCCCEPLFTVFDDGKQKHQSFEVQFTKAIPFYEDLLVMSEVGFGWSEEDATKELIDITKKNIEKLKLMTVFLQTQIDQHESNSNVGSPRNG